MSKTKGWREWAEETVSIQIGCERNCLFCWARILGMQKGYVKSLFDWYYPRPKLSKVVIPRNSFVGFPSTHDITQENYIECIRIIKKILENNNHLLIVTKPDYKIIYDLIVNFDGNFSEEIRKRIEFRFSISSCDEKLLKIYEPHASTFEDRLDSLKEAFFNGYKTSVSIEPYISMDIIKLINKISPFVTGNIWIGIMNYFSSAVKQYPIVEELKYLYTKETVQAIYQEIQDRFANYDGLLERIKFKDTFLKIVQGVEK